MADKSDKPEVETLVGKKSPEELAREFAQAESSEKNKEIEKQIEGKLAENEEKNIKKLSGRDIPFDAEAFIKFGIIRKENIRIAENIFVDMETVTQKNRALAEKLIKARLGESPEDRAYITILDTALLAVAITRINSSAFPNPDILKNAATQEQKDAYASKASLFDMLLGSNQDLIQTLTVVYNGLENADVLIEGQEQTIKK